MSACSRARPQSCVQRVKLTQGCLNTCSSRSCACMRAGVQLCVQGHNQGDVPKVQPKGPVLAIFCRQPCEWRPRRRGIPPHCLPARLRAHAARRWCALRAASSAYLLVLLVQVMCGPSNRAFTLCHASLHHATLCSAATFCTPCRHGQGHGAHVHGAPRAQIMTIMH